MSIRGWLESPRTRLDITAGMVDGILTALTLASGRLLKPGEGASLDLALRVGAATAITTLFVFFVAHYAELRAEITRAERELNLLSHGKLAAGALGRRAVEEAVAGSSLAGLCGLAGAMVPLVLCHVLPSPRWLGLAATVVLLGALGALIARSFHGSSLLWAVLLMVGGIALAWLGLRLDIAG
jgi:VIT1/CCC1 family predicted Fe2+/Mn2+ transporter